MKLVVLTFGTVLALCCLVPSSNGLPQNVQPQPSEKQTGWVGPDEEYEYVDGEWQLVDRPRRWEDQVWEFKQRTKRGLSLLQNQNIELVSNDGSQVVNWKQGSFLGVGGDRSATFRKCTYKLQSSGATILVFIQDKYPVNQVYKVDGRFKYGMQNGNLFLVRIDPDNKPYQHRFVTNGLQSAAYTINTVAKVKYGVDLSWIAGDYLRDI